MRKNLKNYTSDMRIDRIFSGLQEMLASYGAKQIMFDYGDDGKVKGMAFVIDTPKGMVPIKLPARTDKVAKRMYKDPSWLNEKQKDQTYRTAWKNIYDWVDAQLALLETEMVKLEEIFLPYMATPDGHTFFELMENRGFMLPSGKSEEGQIE